MQITTSINIYSLTFLSICFFVNPRRSTEGQSERTQGLTVNTEKAEVTVIPDRPRYSTTSDSDSDGPILYRDEEEDEEEDEYTTSTAGVLLSITQQEHRKTPVVQTL